MKSNEEITLAVLDLESIVRRAGEINSLCLVLDNVLENGQGTKEQYIPSIRLLGELVSDIYEDLAGCFETLHQIQKSGSEWPVNF